MIDVDDLGGVHSVTVITRKKGFGYTNSKPE